MTSALISGAVGRAPARAVVDRVLLQAANRAALRADVARAVQDVSYSGSMESAPALTVPILDPQDDLLRSNLLVRRALRSRDYGDPQAFTLRPIDLTYRGVPYRLTDAERQGEFTDLIFEHRGVAYMRQHTSALSASRGATTRALFIRRQVREAGSSRTAPHRLAFWAPELHVRPPVAAPEEDVSDRAEPDRDVGSIREAARAFRGLEVKGVAMDAEQRRNAAIVDSAFASTGAGQKATLAGWCAAIGESGLRSVMNTAGSPYGGVFQGKVRGGPFDVDDTYEQARCFQLGGKGFQQGGAIKLARTMPGISPGEIATRVEASGKPGSFYEQHRREAEAIMAAGSGVSVVTGTGGSYVKPHQFHRDEGVDGWTSTRNLAEEVGRRRFVTIVSDAQDVFIYAGDMDLMRFRPQAVLDPEDPAVVRLDYDLTMGKTARTATLELLADGLDLAWGLPLMIEGGGPAGGKWLVWDVRSGRGRPTVEVELRQPQPVRPEPAAEVAQRSRDAGVFGVRGQGVEAVLERAKAISQQNLPYVWGGGHARAGKPDGGTGRDPGIGYDCSGYVAACLLAGGMLPDAWKTGVPASGTFASSWGEAGKGKEMTVWANGAHIFLEFHGSDVNYADTSRQAGGPAGPHVRYGKRSTAGFTPRRWRGA